MKSNGQEKSETKSDEQPQASGPVDLRDLRFEVRGDVVQAIVDYLSTKPWGEVNHLMIELSRVPKIEG